MLKKLHAGQLILGTGALVLVFIFILLYTFMQKDLSLVTKDYYEKELVYDRTQEAMHRVIPLDSLFNIKLADGIVELIIPSEINQGLSSCTVQFYYPANELFDKWFQISPTVSNVYSLDKPVSPQACILKIYLHSGDKDYYKEMKI
ncbi:MAG: FixH family protein [Saprospiraceae bacterium]